MASIDLNININNDDNGDNNMNINDQGSYSCHTCGKVYSSVQALGGHQNAHRKERFALKRRHIEMRRQLARQISILPAHQAGPSNMHWPEVLPAAAAPYVVNSMVSGMPTGVDDDVAGGVDLTLRL